MPKADEIQPRHPESAALRSPESVTLRHPEARSAEGSRSRSIAYIALSIALIAVSAWIVVPFGPIPFTLQMFAVPFMILILPTRQAMAAIVGYLVLGAIGVPVFSGMRGGMGILLGPTGGYLWGYIMGVLLGSLLLAFFRKRGFDNFAVGMLAGVVFTACAYICGSFQYAAISSLTFWEAFLITGAPFILLDLLKIAAAVVCARMVRAAVNHR